MRNFSATNGASVFTQSGPIADLPSVTIIGRLRLIADVREQASQAEHDPNETVAVRTLSCFSVRNAWFAQQMTIVYCVDWLGVGYLNYCAEEFLE